MRGPFGNDKFRYGSAAFAAIPELRDAGLFDQQPGGLFIGFKDGRPLWYDGDGGLLMVAGARAGKLRDILGYNLCHSICHGERLMVLDVKGELAAISQNQTPDGKLCYYWNPHSLHGLPQHRLNPFAHLRWSSPTLFSDMKIAMEGALPHSGAASARYFEMNARRIGEAIGLTLVKVNGVLSWPDLYDAVQLLQEGGARWLDFAYEMYRSGVPLCRSVEAEIHAGREDGSGGFKGILGELTQAVACLSDPVLREALSPPFDITLEELCTAERPWQVYMMCPAEMIEIWSPVIKSHFTAAMTIKGRAPQAPRQTWIIDEAARLSGFAHVVHLYTFGAGIGIRPFAIFQDSRQMRALAPEAEHIISSSAALQIYFGVRDIETARRVSDMLGSETLIYDDPLHQGRAALDYGKLVRGALAGGDPFAALFDLRQKRYETVHASKQQRKLRLPDEVMRLPADRHLIFADGLSGAILAERKPYWTMPWMAGRYHPNPYHPPLDRVPVQTRRGVIWRSVTTAPVPEAYAHYPQYRDGHWSFIGENRNG